MICLLFVSIYSIIFNDITLRINNQEKILIYSFTCFSVMIFAFSAYHSSSLNEVDNYSRFLLLLPIYFYLRTININSKYLVYTILISSLLSFGSVLMIYDDAAGNMSIPGRFNPISSSALTFGNLNMTLFILLLGCWIFRDKLKLSSFLLLLGLFVSFLSWGLTHTKGSILGLAIVLIYLNVINKFFRVFSLCIILLGTFIVSSTELNQRFKVFINDTILLLHGESVMSENIDLSVRERVFYYQSAIDIIKNNPLDGIGFDSFENYLEQKKVDQNLNLRTSDHAHNEFLDIALKTGLIGLSIFLILLISIYKFFNTSSSKNSQYSFFECLGKITLLSQTGFMLTQSQLAHHQSTVFFIILILIFASQITYRKNNIP